MTYNENKQKLGKTPVYWLEVDFRSCRSTYGEGTCTASGLAPLKCFNCFSTCQDKQNFDGDNINNDTVKTIRFSSLAIDNLQADGESPTFPTLKTVSTTPTKLTPSKGLGIRSTLNVSIADMPYGDSGLDKYLSERDYNPEDQGSLVGKILARYPFYEGSEGRLFTGYLEDDGSVNPANFQMRTYSLHRITGPDYNGGATFEFKDPLKAADNDRAQFPLPTTATLDTVISAAQTTFTVDDAKGELEQWFIDNPSQRYVIIGEEIMLVDSYTVGTPLSLTVQRAVMPSYYDADTNVAEEHKDGASVQWCYEYTNERIDFILFHLLNVGAGIKSQYLPTSDWSDVIDDSGYISYTLSALLVKPTGVKKLLEELTQLNVSIWWDERTQTIPLAALSLSSFGVPVYNEHDHIVDNSIQITRDVKNRISRMIFGYGLRNPTADMKKTTSFQAVEYKVELDAESDNEYGQRKTLSVFSRWLTVTQRPVASEIANRTLINNRDTKKIATLGLTPKDDAQWTGDIVKLNTRLISDQFGAIRETAFQVLEVVEELKVDSVGYRYTLQEIAVNGRPALITPTDNPEAAGAFPDYTPASPALKTRYAFVSPDSGVFADGTIAYTIQ